MDGWMVGGMDGWSSVMKLNGAEVKSSLNPFSHHHFANLLLNLKQLFADKTYFTKLMNCISLFTVMTQVYKKNNDNPPKDRYEVPHSSEQ